VALLAYGGLRLGEAAALRVRNVDPLRRRVVVAESVTEVGGRLEWGTPKSHRTRALTIPRFVAEALAAHLNRSYPDGAEPEDLVFRSPRGGPLRQANLRVRVWAPALTRAKIPAGLRIHDLRHTAAALLIDAGAHPLAVKEHLGHASIETTMNLYGHLFPEVRERLAEALDAGHAAAVAKLRADNEQTTGGQVVALGAS
jgi:integrase